MVLCAVERLPVGASTGWMQPQHTKAYLSSSSCRLSDVEEAGEARASAASTVLTRASLTLSRDACAGRPGDACPPEARDRFPWCAQPPPPPPPSPPPPPPPPPRPPPARPPTSPPPVPPPSPPPPSPPPPPPPPPPPSPPPAPSPPPPGRPLQAPDEPPRIGDVSPRCLSLVVRWRPVARATHYALVISAGPQPGGPIVYNETVTRSEFFAPQLLSAMQYGTQVRQRPLAYDTLTAPACTLGLWCCPCPLNAATPRARPRPAHDASSDASTTYPAGARPQPRRLRPVECKDHRDDASALGDAGAAAARERAPCSARLVRR